MLALLLSCRPSTATTWAACARIIAPEIDECSGLERSRRYPGVFWVHNDSGDEARIFAIDAQANFICEVQVEGARNVDWEDIASDEAGQLYIGDCGNNRNRRRDLLVYVIDEPDPATAVKGKLRVPVKRRLPFRYAEQHLFPDSTLLNFDCEAMYWRDGGVYLLTKHRSDLLTALYRLDPNDTREQVLERLGDAEVQSPVTAADLSADGSLLAVLSYQYIVLFERTPGSAGENDLAGPMRRVLIEGRQCEALCFDGDRILFTNEQREVYCVPVAYLRTNDRFIPEPPRVAVPEVTPVLDGKPGEWRSVRNSGRLLFDRYGFRPTTKGAGPAITAPEVRLGWSADGLLVQGRLVPPDEGPMLQIMLGGVSANEPQLGRDCAVWDGVATTDGLRLERRWPATSLAEARIVGHRDGAATVFEALLPVENPDALHGGGALLFNVLVRQAGPEGTTAEWGWSASSDMQPLENPLLWGRAELQPR